MSSSVACAPSNMTLRSSARSFARNSDTSPTHGRSRSPNITIWSNSGFQSSVDSLMIWFRAWTFSRMSCASASRSPSRSQMRMPRRPDLVLVRRTDAA
jgi:hypothetical protein